MIFRRFAYPLIGVNICKHRNAAQILYGKSRDSRSPVFHSQERLFMQYKQSCFKFNETYRSRQIHLHSSNYVEHWIALLDTEGSKRVSCDARVLSISPACSGIMPDYTCCSFPCLPRQLRKKPTRWKFCRWGKSGDSASGSTLWFAKPEDHERGKPLCFLQKYLCRNIYSFLSFSQQKQTILEKWNLHGSERERWCGLTEIREINFSESLC